MARKTMMTTKLVLLMALALVLCSMAPSVSAQRVLRADVSDRAFSEPVARALETTTTSSSSKASSSATETLSESESNTASTTAESTTETHPEGPSLSSFTGPMLAGAVAILLIGFVIAFKNRTSS